MAERRGQTGDSEAFHARPFERILEEFGSGIEGLSGAEAADRLAAVGPNRLPESGGRSVLRRIVDQFRSLLVGVLLAASVLAAAIGHGADAVVLVAVVLVNAVVGFVQEGRAEQALAGIRAMVSPFASVRRDGHRRQVPAEDLVPGDLVLLEAGDRVPADLRLIHAESLRADESALTGESVPVDKDPRPVPADAAPGDRTSMAFAGTFVTAGEGAGVVVATAEHTELGRISQLIGGVERLATPLSRRVDRFARQMTVVVLAVSAAIFAYAVGITGYAWADAAMIVVGFAVGAIPEGLPAVLTVTQAIGVRRMARRNAIVRRLPAVETLGSVSVICSDKTGTLTRNEMTARTILTTSGRYEVRGEGYGPSGEVIGCDDALPADANGVVRTLARAALLCNDADVWEREGVWTVAGDPMEGALVAMAARCGLDGAAERARRPRRSSLPFDSRHGYMAVETDGDPGEGVAILVKGAPEAMIARCDRALGASGEGPFDADAWRRAVDDLAAGGQRVLAFASAPGRTGPLRHGDLDGGLVFIGCVGLVDPPRAEAAAAVRQCRDAGISVKMITGDHAETARAIAVELALSDDPAVLTGRDIDRVEDGDLPGIARSTTVFARTTPEHKLRLVEALQSDGSIVAMTGDGVNDAPALKRADIGVAMGGKGTEVAKEASQMVLADDDFATIVAAVREGRTVADNVAKVIAWTLPTNGGEALLIILSVLFGITLPITAIQILWINTATEAALGLALAFERPEADVMKRAVKRPDAGFLGRDLVRRILLVSVLMVVGSFAVHVAGGALGLGIEATRTMVVTAIVAMEIGWLFGIRRDETLTERRSAPPTRALLVSVGCVIAAQAAFIYLPLLQGLFGTVALGPLALLLSIVPGAVLWLVAEADKSAARRRQSARRSVP